MNYAGRMELHPAEHDINELLDDLIDFYEPQAMAHGVPVIGVRTGGVPEVIRDGETGFLLERSDDLGGLTAGLAQLVGDDGFRARCGKQAQEWTRGRFNWSAAAATVKGIVEQLNR